VGAARGIGLATGPNVLRQKRLRRRFVARVGLGLVSLLAGCAPELVWLQPDRAAVPPLDAGQALEVIVTVVGGGDPLAVHGGRIEYAGMADAARRFVAAAARPWVERHRGARAGGWQMLLELVRSDADLRAGRLTVELETRVTLRGTVGQVHLGQTRGYCKWSEAPAGDGSVVVYQCLSRMSRDLAGWLEGLEP